eukprot:CAMPEP_0172493466 /NCGR_PEP_ID=MMETSP1066-20121228/24932_1 /TAXON_ID=671091 /ORGANISM="Coscinodiscus wailesii, Strain CCMP2513" /LENGTH=98 /DNA_ID=CAMNT_0013263663 /DNA_START=107 /DNA_END=403 /DNA_ORIENTATION=+
MSDKIAKLQKATEDAKLHMDEAKTQFEDSLKRLNAAKELLRDIDEEDQNKIQINDTMLPELLDLHRLATEEYGDAKSRYETNSRYLKLYNDKLEQPTL